MFSSDESDEKDIFLNLCSKLITIRANCNMVIWKKKKIKNRQRLPKRQSSHT